MCRYRHGKPCILLKMNKIYNWRPDPYTMDEITNHTTMPLKLKDDISAIWSEKCGGYSSSGWGEDGSYRPSPWLNMVWLHCDGEDDPDKENIGPVGHFLLEQTFRYNYQSLYSYFYNLGSKL